MEDKKTYTDDEIQVLGLNQDIKENTSSKKNKRVLIFLIALLLIAISLLCIFLLTNKEPQQNPQPIVEKVQTSSPTETDITLQGYIDVLEETVNDVPLFVYVPHNAYMELATEMPDQSDKSIIFVAEAADVRADNGEIVGDYVLAGKQLARGERKTGFCAILDYQVIIGMAGQTGILDKTINQDGYFFRQYPLVRDSEVIDNEPKGKSIRRALAIRDNQVIMVESRTRESFHDFAQALADIGVSNAIYICGGSAFGWYRNEEGTMITFGQEKENFPGTNYIVWKTEAILKVIK